MTPEQVLASVAEKLEQCGIDYLRRWSGDLEIDDLLNRLLQEIEKST